MKKLEELITEYLYFCKNRKRLSSKTIKAYQIDLRQFTESTMVFSDPLKKESIEQYILLLHNQYKPKTVKRKIAAIKAFVHYLELEDIVVNNPFHKIQLTFKEPFCLPRTIDFTHLELLFQTLYNQRNCCCANTHKYKKINQDIAIFELLISTGLRVSEVCSLKQSNLNLEENFIRVNGKGSKERLIQLGNFNTVTALKQYQKIYKNELKQDSCFFINRLGNQLSEQSVRNMIVRYCKEANIQTKITPHMFRHTFATMLLDEDVDIRYIQHILGHSSITTTQIYTHISSNKQKDILSAKNPRNKLMNDG